MGRTPSRILTPAEQKTATTVQELKTSLKTAQATLKTVTKDAAAVGRILAKQTAVVAKLSAKLDKLTVPVVTTVAAQPIAQAKAA